MDKFDVKLWYWWLAVLPLSISTGNLVSCIAPVWVLLVAVPEEATAKQSYQKNLKQYCKRQFDL